MRMRCSQRWLLVAILAAPLAFAQSLTVSRLTDFIKSSIEQKNPDKDVAGFLAKVKLTEKLDPSTVDDLQAAGAGPRTVAALKTLATQSASLAAPAPKAPPAAKPTGPPPPSQAE